MNWQEVVKWRKFCVKKKTKKRDNKKDTNNNTFIRYNYFRL